MRTLTLTADGCGHYHATVPCPGRTAPLNFTTIIGLEVHVQLSTRTKIFCGCVNKFNPDQPNTQNVSGLSGAAVALPVINREAIRLGQMTGWRSTARSRRSRNGTASSTSIPICPKGYQTSQFDLPLCQNGWIETFTAEGEARRRSDSASSPRRGRRQEHARRVGRGRDSQVDLNRAGTPLLESSAARYRSAQEAKAVLEELHLLLTYLGVSDCNMQEGSLRCDANVNLHIHNDGWPRSRPPIVEVKIPQQLPLDR